MRVNTYIWTSYMPDFDTDSHSAANAHTAHRPGQPAPPTKRQRTWVPIRSLSSRHRQRIVAHLVGLPEHDRYLRFGHAVSDEQIGRYVDGLDFDRDEIFGIFNRRLQLVAMAHLAITADGSTSAEFGVSVAQAARGRGFGERLFEHAGLHARNRGIDTLIIHALSENTAMLRIARKAGATLERTGSESEAHLKLPPDTLASRMEQLVGDGAAELDYQFKRQARRVDMLLEAIGEVHDEIAKGSDTASS